MVVRQVFKLTFVGNAVLHQKMFGKRNDLQLENFEFSALDYSSRRLLSYFIGRMVSSLSETSDMDDIPL